MPLAAWFTLFGYTLSVSCCVALFASLVSSYVAKMKGRKLCMVIAGVFYLIGAGLTSGAVEKSSGLAMLVIGRCCLGVGVGFGNSVSPRQSSLLSVLIKFLSSRHPMLQFLRIKSLVLWQLLSNKRCFFYSVLDSRCEFGVWLVMSFLHHVAQPLWVTMLLFSK